MSNASAVPTRTLRAIQGDMIRAEARFRHAGRLGYVGCALLAASALCEASAGGDRWPALLESMAVIVSAAVCAYFTRRGNRIASVLLIVTLVGAVAVVTVGDVIPMVFLIALVWGYRLVQGCRATFQFSKLASEYAATWTPRLAQPGDLFSVRDGEQFAIAKLLALEPGTRVHVKLYGVRYPSRPNIVKSETLRRAPEPGDRPVYPHLPLDLLEFLRWEPRLMRPEPVEPEELEPLHTWYRVTGADAGAGIEANTAVPPTAV